LGREVQDHMMGFVAASVKQVSLLGYRRRVNLEDSSVHYKCQFM
jgi:hypothetical protein